jgi:hypothetical protein
LSAIIIAAIWNPLSRRWTAVAEDPIVPAFVKSTPVHQPAGFIEPCSRRMQRIFHSGIIFCNLLLVAFRISFSDAYSKAADPWPADLAPTGNEGYRHARFID